MTRALYRVGRWSAEHGWIVVIIWLVALLSLQGLNRTLGGAADENYNLRGTDSWVAQDLLNRAFPGVAGEANPLVLHSDTLDLSTGEGAARVKAVVAAEKTIPEVRTVVGPADSSALLSDDHHTAQVQITVTDRYAGDPVIARTILDTGTAAAGPQISVALGGFLGRSISRPNTRSSEALGLAAAILVLIITLRRLWAAVIPLINALMAVGIGLALVGLLGKVIFIPDVAPTLGTMLGLGVGIDYALFLVARHRLLLRQGFEMNDSVGRTTGTAGAAMVFAGGTLIAAVVGLTLTGLSFLAWLGIAAGIVVAVAVLASITLVPAILGLMGTRVVPKAHRELTADDVEALDNSRWARLATAVTSRPWFFAIGSTLVLLLLASPVATLSLGHSDASVLPTATTARQAEDMIRVGFGVGESSPLAVVTQLYEVAQAPDGAKGEGDPRRQDPRLVDLRNALKATPGVVRVDEPVISTDGGISTIRVIPEWSSSDPRTEALVRDLRSNVLPAVDAGNGMQSHVGGVTALNIDLAELISGRTPWFIAGVVSLAFLLLMLAYRSLLIPIKAAAMNLLSIAAAYGVITMVFQWGWGASLIGLNGPVPIDSFVPMMIFAVLFGLSMDYEVFLLTAFREQWERTGDMVVSVRRGLADTGRIVTAAALIMVVVFLSFILSPDPTVKIFGVGLATAVAVDATIVRCLLVPAIMVLAAKGTWWLPGWLDRLLPHVHVEGDPAAIDLAGPEHSAASSDSERSGSLVLRRPVVAIGAIVGAAAGFVIVWLLADHASPATIALSAVMGTLLAVLPAAATAGRGGLGRRLFGYLIGVVVAMLTSAVMLSIVPPARSSTGVATTAAIVVVALLVVLVVGRSIAVPVLIGAVVVAFGLIAAEPAVGAVLLLVTVLPAVVAAIVAAAVGGIGSQPAVDAISGDEPQLPETLGDRVPLELP